MTASPDVIVKMVLSAWDSQNKRTNKLLDDLSDEQLMSDIAPGRNSGFYILGHLVAVHDYLFPVLGFGERLHPELETVFLTNPDKSGLDAPSLVELRGYWRTINQQLTERFATLTTDDWFAAHTTVSADDFAKEPHRNKLNVVMGRTSHLNYHLGQLILLK